MDCFEQLANAIILQAVQDYREARKQILTFQRTDFPSDDDFSSYRMARTALPSLKRFFYSDWFSTLTSLDGRLLFERLEKECDKIS